MGLLYMRILYLLHQQAVKVSMSAAFTSFHKLFSQFHVHTQSINVDKDSDQNLESSLAEYVSINVY